MFKEISVKKPNTNDFIGTKIDEIRCAAGDGLAIKALSGGADSSTVNNRRYLAAHGNSFMKG